MITYTRVTECVEENWIDPIAIWSGLKGGNIKISWRKERESQDYVGHLIDRLRDELGKISLLGDEKESPTQSNITYKTRNSQLEAQTEY